MRDQFKERAIPWLYYRADNLQRIAGHVRIFGLTAYR